MQHADRQEIFSLKSVRRSAPLLLISLLIGGGAGYLLQDRAPDVVSITNPHSEQPRNDPPQLPRGLHSTASPEASLVRPEGVSLADMKDPIDLAPVFLTLDQRFRADKADAPWANATEKTLLEAASDPALENLSLPTTFDARCAGRMCKITMSFADANAANDWSDLYLIGAASAVSRAKMRVQTASDGRSLLTIFATRHGSETLLNM